MAQAGAQGPAGPAGAQGPAGPAGLSTGFTTSVGGGLVLNQAVANVNPADTLQLLATAAPLTTGGTYYVTATVVLSVTNENGVDCVMSPTSSASSENGVSGDVGPVSVPGGYVTSLRTVGITESMSLAAGDQPTLWCSGLETGTAATVIGAQVTGILIDNSSAPAVTAKPSASPNRPSLPVS